MKVVKPETIKRILEMRKEGKSYYDIEKEVKVCRRTARKYCLAYGVEELEPLKVRRSPEEMKMVENMYLHQGMSPSDIVMKTGIPRTTVIRMLEICGARKPRFRRENPEFDKPMPPLKPRDNDPIYYPERTLEKKVVNIGGKQYQDMSALFGL